MIKRKKIIVIKKIKNKWSIILYNINRITFISTFIYILISIS